MKQVQNKNIISPIPIRDKETFEDYQIRVERDGSEANRTAHQVIVGQMRVRSIERSYRK